MSENSVVWHPYPKEKPDFPITKTSSFGEYYTAYEFLVTQKLTGGVSRVITSVYFNGAFKANDVTAWAEMPKPYNEEAERSCFFYSQCDDDCEHCEWATCPKMEVEE